MKKFKKLLLSFIMIFLSTIGLFGCDNGSEQATDIQLDENGNIITPENPVEVNFWGWGDKEEVEVFNKIVTNFNEKYAGKIKVNYIQRPSNSYAETLLIQLSGKKGPDVFYAQDKIIKQYATLGYCVDLTDYMKNSKFDTKLNENDLFSNILSRYRYDTVTTTSNADDPLWAVPKDLAPTAIYYNKKHFENAGITIISKTEAEMKAANEPVKAYFYDNAGTYTDPIFKGWVFNNKIPMNWEECYLLSKDLMAANKDTKGFFSEWWFNYGWSVGGNCVQYVETDDANYNEGRYKFTLNDLTKNYIVKEGVESVTVNGHVYRSGETISYQDKVETANIFTNENPTIRQEVLNLLKDGKLNELPSQREAFTEFVRLSHSSGKEVDDVNGVYSSISDFYGAASNGKITGYGIAPNPTAISADGKTGYFTAGKVSMLVDTMSKVKQIRANMKDEWDVCPMLQYKEWEVCYQINYNYNYNYNNQLDNASIEQSFWSDTDKEYSDYISLSGNNIMPFVCGNNIQIEYSDILTNIALDISPINVYPNPSKSGIVFIDTDLIVHDIAVFDINGILLYQNKYTNHVNLSHLNNGMYIIQITTNEGKYSFKQIINNY